MIKMIRVYGDMYVPREYCTFTNSVTSGGTEELDYVDMPCENGCNKVCENCTLQKIMNEYARLTRQDIDEKKRHCEECENYKEIRKGPRGGKKGICRILRPSEIRNGRARACKRFRVQKTSTEWTEYSVDEIGDVTDRSRWAACNPALGRRMRESTIAAECEQMSEDTFARERLGWWSPVNNEQDYAIDRAKWKACVSDQKKPEGKTAYGVKFSADGSVVALCGAVCPEEGAARISLIEFKATDRGIQWLADWLNERYQTASCVVVDGRNGVEFLIEKIISVWRNRQSIVRPSGKDVIAAASQLVQEINEQTVTWYKYQEVLNESAITSVKRAIAGGWGFGGENSTPIEAAALALWGCRTSKRNPTKKMRIG